MKKTYIDLTEAYKLVTPGVPVLIGTKGKNPGQYNLAPIAWNCPLDYEPVTKVLFVSDPAHQTALNAKREGRFAFCIPLSDSVPEIEKCGSVSDPEADKFKLFDIKSIPCEKIPCLQATRARPRGCLIFPKRYMPGPGKESFYSGG